MVLWYDIFAAGFDNDYQTCKHIWSHLIATNTYVNMCQPRLSGERRLREGDSSIFSNYLWIVDSSNLTLLISFNWIKKILIKFEANCLISNVLVVISQYINYSQIYISWGKRIFQCWRKSFLVIIVNLSVKQPKWCKILLCNTQRKLVRSIDCSIMKITNIFVRTNKILHKIDKMAQCWPSFFNKIIWWPW